MFKIQTVKAHCDIPCGIYDPISAQIAALSVIRMVDLMNSLEKSDDLDYINTCVGYLNMRIRMHIYIYIYER